MKKIQLRKLIREVLSEQGGCYGEDGKPMPEAHCMEENVSEDTIAQIDTMVICACPDGYSYEFTSNQNVNFYGDCQTLCMNYTMPTDPNPPVRARRVRDDKGAAMGAQNTAPSKGRSASKNPPVHPSMKRSQLRKAIREIIKKLK